MGSRLLVLSDLRAILRHFRRWPSTKCRDGPYWRFVMHEYRRNADQSDPAIVQALRRNSRDYAALLSNVSEFNRLRELDTGAENVIDKAELLRKAAARAGLSTPTSD